MKVTITGKKLYITTQEKLYMSNSHQWEGNNNSEVMCSKKTDIFEENNKAGANNGKALNISESI